MVYVLRGELDHEDFLGNSNRLSPGDVQLTTAGKGMVSCQMPVDENKETWVLRLQINLAADQKFCNHNYQTFKPMSTELSKGLRPTVIAGEAFGVKGPIQGKTPF